MVIATESMLNPKNCSSWQGIRIDFGRFTTNLRASSRATAIFAWYVASSSVGAMIKLSSMYVIILQPSCLSHAIAGRIIFVKILGADDRPNGRQLN